MLYSFGGRNFFSFRDEFTVDFRTKVQSGEREIFQRDATGQKVNSVMAIFGANASGKTHLLQALGFLHWFVIHSAQSKPDEKLGDKLGQMFFCFQPKIDHATDLFIEFRADEQHYRYELRLDAERVLREALHVYKERWNYIFVREWSGSQYNFKSQDFGDDAAKTPQRQNASFISTALLLENPVARRLDRFFGGYYGNLCSLGRSEQHDPHIMNLFQTAEFFEEHPEHLNWVKRRLKNFDLGLDDIVLEKGRFIGPDGKETERPVPLGVHHYGRGNYRLPLYQESRGTQALFILLRYILPVLESGGVAFIDEFELGLHSHMIPCLVDLFYTKKYNSKGAQLIFSCHADYVLSQLEKYQIQLVDKDEEGVSTTYRLDTVQGVRNVDNHYAKYHAGSYGGIPDF